MSNAVRRLALAAGVLLLAVTSPLTAQEAGDGADAGTADATTTDTDASRLPADSLALGAQYVEWMLNYRADSLWARFSDDMRENFGSVGDFKDGMGDIFRQIGDQERIVSQRYWMRNGKPQYWHTAQFSGIPEPVVIRFAVEPDGTISGLGLNPQSQNPPVDDPEQDGELEEDR